MAFENNTHPVAKKGNTYILKIKHGFLGTAETEKYVYSI